MKRLIWIFIPILFSCGENPKEKIVEAKVVDDFPKQIKLSKELSEFDTFLIEFTRFIDAVFNKDTLIVNEYIAEDSGLYTISSSGAMPEIEKFHKAQNLFQHSGFMLYENLNEKYISMLPKLESLPKVVCDDNVYDKQGCFAQEINTLLASEIWNYTNLSEKEIKEIEVLAQTIKMTVVNTSNFTFYFSKIDDTWYLTFIDLRVPCQA